MSPAAISRLRAAIAFVEAEIHLGTPAVEIIDRAAALHGAVCGTRGGSYTLRIATVTGSCTWSREAGLLTSWFSCALRHLANAGAPFPTQSGDRP